MSVFHLNPEVSAMIERIISPYDPMPEDVEDYVRDIMEGEWDE